MRSTRSVRSQRNLVADASHELRTPIATIRANLQLMRDEELLSAADREALRHDVIEELDELTALVGDVVELARGSKLSGEPAEVRVDQIVTAAVERTRRRAPQLTVAASVEPTLVQGEGDRIARAVANLLDNAAKYGQSGGSIEVTLAGGTLTVRDHGPGFHDEDLPFVFDRFHRARDARSQPGSGLGLAIVRQAAEAHDGFVRASNAAGRRGAAGDRLRSDARARRRRLCTTPSARARLAHSAAQQGVSEGVQGHAAPRPSVTTRAARRSPSRWPPRSRAHRHRRRRRAPRRSAGRRE